jgi:hypothetical protein
VNGDPRPGSAYLKLFNQLRLGVHIGRYISIGIIGYIYELVRKGDAVE